jgi:outer membrane immunogenic protein
MNSTAARVIVTAVVLVGLVAGRTAHAQARPAPAGPYAEVGYAWMTLSTSGQDVSTQDLVARMGMDFMPYLGGEIFGGTSASGGDLYGVSLKVDNMYGAYLKLHAEIATEFELFARAGWVHSTVKASYAGFGGSSSDDDLSYGIGLQFMFADHWYMQGDYMSYYSKQGDTIKGPSLSVGYRF